jgi:hypothetical protein
MRGKRIWRIPAKLVLATLVYGAICECGAISINFVIDLLTESRLLTQVSQNATEIQQTLRQLQLAQTMATELTHPSAWKSLIMHIVINAPRNLYGETVGWDQIWTAGAPVNVTWFNSAIPLEQDPYYTSGPGTAFAANTATAEIADATAQDALASVQTFYQNKPLNDTATQALQSDFADAGNDTYLGQARVTNGIGLQALASQQDMLTQLTNLTRIQSVAVKQIRDQNTDGTNFSTDLHMYQATSGVSIGGGLAAEFQAY